MLGSIVIYTGAQSIIVSYQRLLWDHIQTSELRFPEVRHVLLRLGVFLLYQQQMTTCAIPVMT